MSAKKIHISFSFLMASLLLISSTSLSVDMHFCGNTLKSISFFGKAKNCFELAAMPSNCKHHTKKSPTNPHCKQDKKDCCQNKNLVLKADFDYDKVKEEVVRSFDFQDLVVFDVFTSSSKYHFSEIFLPFPYKPPLLFRDIPVLVQAFLL